MELLQIVLIALAGLMIGRAVWIPWRTWQTKSTLLPPSKVPQTPQPPVHPPSVSKELMPRVSLNDYPSWQQWKP